MDKVTDDSHLRRVRWYNGDVISEDHFLHLERWIEGLSASAHRRFRSHGLIRNPRTQPRFNSTGTIKLTLADANTLQAEIRDFEFISSSGVRSRVLEPLLTRLPLPAALRATPDLLVLYLRPGYADTPGPSDPSGIEAGVALLSPSPVLSLQNEDGEGTPVCRFRIEDRTPKADPAFLPPCVSLDGSPELQARHGAAIAGISEIIEDLLRYASARKPEPLARDEASAEREAARDLVHGLLRILVPARAGMLPASQPPAGFLLTLHAALAAAALELRLVASRTAAEWGWKAGEMASRVELPLPVEHEYPDGLTEVFAAADASLERLREFLPFLPGGAQRTIEIGAVSLSPDPTSNRLLIAFRKEEEFTPGVTLLSLRLREFTKSPPRNDEVRAGLGNVIYPQLEKHADLLRPAGVGGTDFLIDLPASIVTRLRAAQLVVYLPKPLGEGIQNLPGKVTLARRN